MWARLASNLLYNKSRTLTFWSFCLHLLRTETHALSCLAYVMMGIDACEASSLPAELWALPGDFYFAGLPTLT